MLYHPWKNWMCRPNADAMECLQGVTQCSRHPLDTPARLLGSPIALGLSNWAFFENDLLTMLFAADLSSSPFQFNDGWLLIRPQNEGAQPRRSELRS